MPNEMNSAPSDLIPEVDSKPVKPQPFNNDTAKPKDTGDVKPVRARRTSPKPLVEGINTPVAGPEPAEAPAAPSPTLEPAATPVIPPKITLTNSEKQLIEDPTLAPAAAAKKTKVALDQPVQKITLPGKKGSRKFVWSLLIALLAVCLVYGGLLWYNNQSGGKLGENFSMFPKRPTTQTPSAANPNPAPVENPSPSPATSTVPVQTPPAASTTPTPAPAAATQLKVTNTPTGYLNVRSSPATSGTLVGQVHPGEVYTYTKVQTGWYYITLPGGKQGWVIGQYVQVLK